MLLEHLSVSRLQTYEQCPEKYKFKYELKTPSPEPQPVYFLFGKTLHKIAETYVLERGKKSIDSIAKAVLNGKILLESNQLESPKKGLPPDYLAKIPSHLNSLLKIINLVGFDGLVEHKFDYDLEKGKVLTGYIDRLVPHSNGMHYIIDYKTTKKSSLYRKDRLNISSDVQLKSYALVASKQMGIDPKKIKAGLYYLDGGDLISATFTEKILEQTEQMLLEAYNTIAAQDPETVKGRVSKLCEYCEFRKLCKFYSLT